MPRITIIINNNIFLLYNTTFLISYRYLPRTMSRISLHISPKKSATTRHSYSSSRSPVEFKEYNKLRKDPIVIKALECQAKLGEILGAPLRYGASDKEREAREEKIAEYRSFLDKNEDILSRYETAKIRYRNKNIKLKGGLRSRKNRSRRFRR